MYTYHDQVELFKSLEHEEKKAICQIILEFKRAKELHPKWKKDYVFKAAIVSEEAGELIRAALQFEHEGGEFDAMTTEAVQTGAMALRFLTEK